MVAYERMSSELIEHGVQAAEKTATPVPLTKPNMRLLGLLALGHMVVDINGGSLTALLPFLKSALSLSYTSSAAVVLMSNVTSSLIQPVFGYFADKTSRRWLLPIAVFLSGLGIALTGLAPTYGAVLLLVIVSGIGIASYHPEGYRTATHVAGDRKATGVSIFSTGGNLGIALGPPIITALVTAFGLVGSVGMLIPGTITALLIAAVLPKLTASESLHQRRRHVGSGKKSLYGMAILIIVVAMR